MAYPHEREVEVFEAALELPPGQREAFLARETAGNPELLQRVQALLHAAEKPTEFLPLTPSKLVPPLPPTEKPGDRIGRYKLLEQIGEGGCGIVYMAAQEEPIRRRVAAGVQLVLRDMRTADDHLHALVGMDEEIAVWLEVDDDARLADRSSGGGHVAIALDSGGSRFTHLSRTDADFANGP